MERDEGGELDRLRSFVQGEIPGVSTVSASVRCTFNIWRNELLDFNVELGRTLTGDHLFFDDRDTKIPSLNLRFRVQDVVLEAFEMLVACPTLTDLSLSFPFESVGPLFPSSQHLPITRLVLLLFAVVRTSRSLTTLDISFLLLQTNFQLYLDEKHLGLHFATLDTYYTCFFHADLPILLRDNPLFEKLTFYLGWSADHPQTSLAYCFTRSPNLNLCELATLRYSEWANHRCYPLWSVVRKFTPLKQSELLNVEVRRELVMKTNPLGRRCGDCLRAITNMVERNSILVRLEVDEYLLHHKDKLSLMTQALACNQSLQDLGFRCTTADFKQLVRVFIADASGCQANSSLSTLKLTFPKKTDVEDCMIVLGQLVECNTTLKHVELCLDLLNCRRREKDREWKIRQKLEQMLNNELRRNTCLQTLCVGAWRLVREGAADKWEMSFEGPCLGLKEFVVKVKV